ncbi:conserved hypothetical protein [Gloeothece citriformis PCC 7424]|uniref:DZANK-type domain-containing protein n=1 Tax=Gloeothece citriformis (strain PCC 7424) TaxID=65393 RepID=B7KER3_GLOC7|nr:hypothetical protein [Gloeothece citriformis]ACK69088.1 conserved hypothetical protein [Gloeothece citriformis PCC 7424]
MATCSRCHQLVDNQAVRCPHCGNQLKGFGHPGIPLYQAEKDTFLCESCLYHEDDSCNFPQRPYAKTCTLYQDKHQPLIHESPKPSLSKNVRLWVERNRWLILLIGLIMVSIALAI